MPDVFTTVHRAPIILAAARNNVPAVSSLSDFARDGGLLSYALHFLRCGAAKSDTLGALRTCRRPGGASGPPAAA
jgi:hypothetical protein